MMLRALILLIATCLPVQAQVLDEYSSLPSLYSRAFLLVDLQSGAVLAQKNADERIEPASLTKLMTAYLVFEALYQKRLTLQQKVIVSEKAWRAPGARMFLEPDSEVSVEDLGLGRQASDENQDQGAQRHVLRRGLYLPYRPHGIVSHAAV